MNKKIVIPVVISLLALGAVLWLLVTSMSPGDDRSELAETLDGETDVEQAADLDDVESPEDEAAEEVTLAFDADEVAGISTADGALLQGRVLDAYGKPLVGAQVILRNQRNIFSLSEVERTEEFRRRFLDSKNQRARRSGPIARGRTDRDGRYGFPVDRLPRGHFELVASAEGFAPSTETWRWVETGSRVDFQLDRGETIRGFVRDPNGRFVAGAWVSAIPENEERGFFGRGGFGGSTAIDETRTNRRGEFTLNVYPGEFRVDARHDKWAPASLRSQPSGADGVELELETGRQIAGRVQDEAGVALAGVEVALFRSGFGGGGGGRRGGRGGRGFGRMPTVLRQVAMAPEATTLSGTDGSFVFNALPAGDFLLHAEKSRYVPEDESAEIDDEDEFVDVEITLEEGRNITGRVFDPDGEPVVGAFVLIGEDDGGERRGRGDRGDRGGRGRGDRGDRGRGGRRGGSEDRRDGGRGDGESEAEQAAREEERRLAREREPVSVWRARHAAETDRSGRFTFDALNNRVYALSVEAEGYVPRRVGEIDLTENRAEEVEIRLDIGLTLAGTVFTSDDEPVVGATVAIGDRGGSRKAVETDDEGRYELTGLVPGELGDVRFAAKGFTPARVEDVVLDVEPEVQELDTHLEKVASITGRVVDTKGQPVARARVRSEIAPVADDEGDGDPREAMRRRMREFRNRRSMTSSTRTDSDGRFVIDDVNAGDSMRLDVEHPDYKDLETEAFAIAPGEAREDIEVVLSPGGRLVLSVFGAEGEPARGVRVIARMQVEESEEDERGDGGFGRGGRGRGGFGRGGFGGTRPLVRETRRDGVVIFGGIEGGTYAISVSERGFQPFETVAAVVEDEDTAIDIRLLPENVITGVVRDLAGAPISDVTVRARKSTEDSSDDGERGRGRGRGRDESFARSDENGFFRLGSLGAGPYSVRFDRRGYVDQSIDEVAVNTEVEVTLESLGEIRGVVVSSVSDAPVEEFVVLLSRSEADVTAGEVAETLEDGGRRGRGGRGRGRDGGDRRGSRPRRFEDAGGEFVIDDLDPGAYRVEVAAAGYTSTSIQAVVESGPAGSLLRFVLDEGLAVVGSVLDRKTQAPIAGAEVWLLPLAAETTSTAAASGDRRAQREAEREARLGGRGRRGGDDDDENSATALALLGKLQGRNANQVLTDASGQFVFEDSAPGSYQVVVHHEAYAPSVASTSLREDRVSRELRVRLAEGEKLQGRISFEDRSSTEGLTLHFEDTRGLKKTVQVDGRGRFNATGFVEGSYEVRFELGGKRMPATETVIIGSSKNELEVELPPIEEAGVERAASGASQ